MPRRFLDELEPGGDTELGVDVGEVGLHGPRSQKEPSGDVFVAQTFGDQSDDAEFGRGQRLPAVGRAFAFAAAALRVADCFFGAQRRTFCTRGIKSLWPIASRSAVTDAS